MPVFSPPKSVGAPYGDPDSFDPSRRLMSFYGGVPTGVTVWKDQSGIWHQQQYPYAGRPDSPGLDQAQKVYLGGSEYDISDSEATELLAQGYQLQGHWESEEDKWVTYGINSAINNAWKGGDSCASIRLPETGDSIWLFADNLVGSNNPDGSYIFALPARNAMVVQDPSGVITSQIYHDFVTQPWSVHPVSPSTKWYWPIAVVFDVSESTTECVISCWEMIIGGLFGLKVQNTLIKINLFGLPQTYTDIPTPTDKFWITDFYRDTTTGYTYIIGNEWEDELRIEANQYSRMARAPIGSLLTASTWEFWNGTTWVAGETNARRLIDTDNASIVGTGATITKAGSNYILAVKPVITPGIQVYYSTSPAGPWKLYHTQTAEGGDFNRGGVSFTYLPKFHSHLNPSSNTLVLSYNVNRWTTGSADPLTSQNIRDFSPRFHYIPTPT